MSGGALAGGGRARRGAGRADAPVCGGRLWRWWRWARCAGFSVRTLSPVHPPHGSRGELPQLPLAPWTAATAQQMLGWQTWQPSHAEFNSLPIHPTHTQERRPGCRQTQPAQMVARGVCSCAVARGLRGSPAHAQEQVGRLRPRLS